MTNKVFILISSGALKRDLNVPTVKNAATGYTPGVRLPMNKTKTEFVRPKSDRKTEAEGMWAKQKNKINPWKSRTSSPKQPNKVNGLENFNFDENARGRQENEVNIRGFPFYGVYPASQYHPRNKKILRDILNRKLERLDLELVTPEIYEQASRIKDQIAHLEITGDPFALNPALRTECAISMVIDGDIPGFLQKKEVKSQVHVPDPNQTVDETEKGKLQEKCIKKEELSDIETIQENEISPKSENPDTKSLTSNEEEY